VREEFSAEAIVLALVAAALVFAPLVVTVFVQAARLVA